MFTRLFVNVCLWFADRHTECAAVWNDIAAAVLTGKSTSEIRKELEEKDGRHLD